MKNSIPCPGCQEEICCGYVHCTAPAKGNVVAEYRYPDGSRAIIMDSGFANKTKEELKEIEDAAWRLNWSVIKRNLIENNL